MPPAAPTAASKLAQNLAEEEAAINVRLLTHVSAFMRGKRTLFKSLTQGFLAVAEAAQKGTLEDVQAAQQAFLKEMDSLELQLNRFQAANEANEREQESYAAKQQQLEAQIAQAHIDIEAKKQELQAARVVRQHNEEYEVIRGLIVEQPKRSVTQAAIDSEQQHIEALLVEQRRHQATMEQKRRSFALLLQCIEELQRIGDDDGGSEPVAGGSGAAAMQIDG